MATFTLDTSTLVGAIEEFGFSETIIEDRGRGIQVKWEQAATGANMILTGYSIRYTPAELESRESPGITGRTIPPRR